MKKNPILVALDVSDPDKAAELVNLLSPFVAYFKVGLEMLMGSITDRRIAQFISELGPKMFVDCKLHDIPATMAATAKNIVALKPAMFNMHASAGVEAMSSVVAVKGDSLVLAVTVLTSLDEDNCHLIYGDPSKAKVLQLARDAKLAGADGIICSPKELEFLGKQKELTSLIKVTPGVRPVWAAANDQKRMMTPGEAIKAGASYLVIGRPITNPPTTMGSPVNAVEEILSEINTVA